MSSRDFISIFSSNFAFMSGFFVFLILRFWIACPKGGSWEARPFANSLARVRFENTIQKGTSPPTELEVSMSAPNHKVDIEASSCFEKVCSRAFSLISFLLPLSNKVAE